MDRRLDEELKALKTAGADPRLDRLEPSVWRRIAAVRDERGRASVFLPVRAATVVCALAVGAASGGITAAAVAGEPHEVSAFAIDTPLAPSTLLDRHG